MSAQRAALIWSGILAICVVPVLLAAYSPYLAWRQPVYIASGFAGIIGLILIFLQPLLAGGYLPKIGMRRARMVHRWTGAALVLAVIIHVGGLWLTSPPDVIDALTFTSPTPFSDWGVIAMWALFAAASLGAARAWLRLPPRIWRLAHTALVVIATLGTIVHALLIEGTMEPISKAILCVLAMAALFKTLRDLRSVALLRTVLRRS
ncbi:MAG: ferric reductase-like transmembrane domain-containing protein [Pseudomonadota bacterium]